MTTISSTAGRSNARRTWLATLGAVVAAAGVAAGPATAAPAAPEHHTDVITFTSHVHLTPPEAATGHFILLADTCLLQSDDAPAVPCTFRGAGTVSPDGGTAHGVVTSERGVIDLDEVFTWTGPATLAATGTATETLTGAGAERTTGTFAGDFTAAPTDKPNVLSDWGTITIAH
jgi:hypothetical protein